LFFACMPLRTSLVDWERSLICGGCHCWQAMCTFDTLLYDALRILAFCGRRCWSHFKRGHLRRTWRSMAAFRAWCFLACPGGPCLRFERVFPGVSWRAIGRVPCGVLPGATRSVAAFRARCFLACPGGPWLRFVRDGFWCVLAVRGCVSRVFFWGVIWRSLGASAKLLKLAKWRSVFDERSLRRIAADRRESLQIVLGPQRTAPNRCRLWRRRRSPRRVAAACSVARRCLARFGGVWGS
jgi:hypothetical protein